MFHHPNVSLHFSDVGHLVKVVRFVQERTCKSQMLQYPYLLHARSYNDAYVDLVHHREDVADVCSGLNCMLGIIITPHEYARLFLYTTSP